MKSWAIIPPAAAELRRSAVVARKGPGGAGIQETYALYSRRREPQELCSLRIFLPLEFSNVPLPPRLDHRWALFPFEMHLYHWPLWPWSKLEAHSTACLKVGGLRLLFNFCRWSPQHSRQRTRFPFLTVLDLELSRGLYCTPALCLCSSRDPRNFSIFVIKPASCSSAEFSCECAL